MCYAKGYLFCILHGMYYCCLSAYDITACKDAFVSGHTIWYIMSNEEIVVVILQS